VLKEPVRIGFLGGGMIAQTGHLPFYLADRRVEVVLISEERPSLQAALADMVGHERVVPAHDDLLAHPDIDAIVVCAPRPAVGPLTLQVLAAGKHALVEKPMAHTIDQAQRLVELARSKGLIYAVAFMKLFDPGVQAAKVRYDDIVATARLGRALSARFYDFSKSYAVAMPPHTRPGESRTVRYPTWPTHPDWLAERHRATYAWFLNAASHDISLLRHFFPGPIDVLGADSPNDGAVSALLRSNGVAIMLEVAKTEAGVWMEGAEFLFERGRLALAIPSPMAVDRVGEVTLDELDRRGERQTIATGTGWCFQHQAKAFVDILLGNGPRIASGNDGLKGMELTEAIWRRIQG
jgi:predicted dehydrogenase